MNDKNNAVKKLQSAAKSIRYTKLDVSEVKMGSPKEFLKLYHYLFVDYSTHLAAEILNKHQMELSMKSDKSFMDGVYKLTRDMFDYGPKLTRDQFFTANYAQVKALMAADIIQLVHAKVKSLQPPGTTAASASASSSVISSFNHLNPQPASSSIAHLPIVMPSASQSSGSSVFKAVKAIEEAPKLAIQGPKSTRSQVHLHSQPPTGHSLGRSSSVNYGMSHGYRESISNHLSRHSSRNIPSNVDSDSEPRQDVASSFLAKNVSDISANLNLLLARMEKFEKFVQTQQQSDDADLKNSTVVHRDTTEATEELRIMIMADRMDHDNTVKRVTLLENEILVLKHQNKLLNAQLGQQQAFIQTLLNQQTTPNHGLGGNRGSGIRTNGPLLHQDYSDEENREESDLTAFETPLHSFMVSNEDEEASSSRRSNSRKVSSSTTSSQSSTADYVQIPTIGSTTTPHRQLLAQGVLHDAQNLSEALEDLSLSSNQITDPNDLTPTLDKSSANRHLFGGVGEPYNSPLSNDAIIRAKQLVDRASQLNEQILAKK